MSTTATNGRIRSSAAADLEGIAGTARDYIEGWLDGDADRMRRCLHPDLVKRTVRTGATSGEWILGNVADAKMMIGWTEAGEGRTSDDAGRQYEIVVDDAFHRMATVRVNSSEFFDYLHLAKVGNRWLIVHVLWEPREAHD
jgi:hypothetical protein